MSDLKIALISVRIDNVGWTRVEFIALRFIFRDIENTKETKK